MQQCNRVEDRALAEMYTLLLISYENFVCGELPRSDYELIKRNYLYDRNIFMEFYTDFARRPSQMTLADPLKKAKDILYELLDIGAINKYEFKTQMQKYTF